MKGHAREHTQFKCGNTGATEGFNDYPGYCGKCNADLDLDLYDAHLEYLRMFEQDKDRSIAMTELGKLHHEGLFHQINKNCKDVLFRGKMYKIKKWWSVRNPAV